MQALPKDVRAPIITQPKYKFLVFMPPAFSVPLLYFKKAKVTYISAFFALGQE